MLPEVVVPGTPWGFPTPYELGPWAGHRFFDAAPFGLDPWEGHQFFGSAPFVTLVGGLGGFARDIEIEVINDRKSAHDLRHMGVCVGSGGYQCGGLGGKAIPGPGGGTKVIVGVDPYLGEDSLSITALAHPGRLYGFDKSKYPRDITDLGSFIISRGQVAIIGIPNIPFGTQHIGLYQPPLVGQKLYPQHTPNELGPSLFKVPFRVF